MKNISQAKCMKSLRDLSHCNVISGRCFGYPFYELNSKHLALRKILVHFNYEVSSFWQQTSGVDSLMKFMIFGLILNFYNQLI